MPIFRAANFLTVGQIYLRENPLLREPLRPERHRSLACSVALGNLARPESDLRAHLNPRDSSR